MKRIHLIEWGIITIALIFGYKFFETIFSLIIQFVNGFYGDDVAESILKILFIAGLYAGMFIVLLRNSFSIAKKVTPAESQGETLPVKIGKRALTHVILLGLCLYSLLTTITRIILYLFNTFKQEVGNRGIYDDAPQAISKYDFQLAAGQAIVALIVLYFSKDIVNWFIRKNEADELVLDSKPENETDVHH
jgi:hypothetical protein